MIRRIGQLGAALALVSGTTTLAMPAVAAAAPHVAGQHEVLATAASAGALPHGARFSTQLAPGLRTYVVRVPDGVSAAAYTDRIRSMPGVIAAQPNSVLTTTKIASPCAEAPTEQNRDIPTALKVGQTTRETEPIAILDTGVDINTPELGIRVRPGFNVVTGTDITEDTDGHGTEVASAAAGSAVEGLVSGASPRSPILPITIYNDAGDTTADWVVKGIAEAYKRGAGVINISSSSAAVDAKIEDIQVLQLAIATAFNRGVLTVAAIGNEGTTDVVIPGALPHLLTVGSASAIGVRDNFSNLGPWLDLVAPGANLTLPAPPSICTSGYGQANGTSFAAPEIAGGVSLIRAAQPKLTPVQLFDLSRQIAVTPFNVLGEGLRNNDTGFGMLDVTAGATAKPLANEPTEIDDDVYWLKQDPKGHPTLLKSGRRAKVVGAVSPGKDPQDVIAISLKRGQTLTASATGKSTNGIFEISLWSPTTGRFDIGRQSEDTRQPITDSGGLSRSPRVVYQARQTGTFYIAVGAPDTADTTDNSVSQVEIDPRIAYSLSLTKTKATAIKKKTVKKK